MKTSKHESPDYYDENGLIVFTEAYHLKRGYCCESGCRHCPYGFTKSARQRVSISWSGGKDSAFALYRILLSGKYDVVSLHTVIAEDTLRVGLHGMREELIEQQAEALGFPLKKLYLKTADDHNVYVELMNSFYGKAKEEGIQCIVFGDIFLEDLKRFREQLLQDAGLLPVFPIWKEGSSEILRSFIAAGFKTLICSADASLLEKRFLGKTIDHSLLDSLPNKIDPCGENGEFHTFVYDGPIFKKPVQFEPGDVIKKEYSFKKINGDEIVSECKSTFWFQDLTFPDASR
jgi:uncharacterized protein (TIGR00290 family)